MSNFRDRFKFPTYMIKEKEYVRPDYPWSWYGNYDDLPDRIVDGTRLYSTPHGDFPSVTTVLAGSKPEDSRSYIDGWRDSIGHEKADEITRKAAERGTALHDLCEKFITGNFEGNSLKTENRHFEQVYPHLKKIGKVFACEEAIYNKRLRLAGRVDLCAEYEGIPSIIDFKTSTREKEEYEINEYKLQLTAYKHLMGSYMSLPYKITQGVIIMAMDGLDFTEAKVFKIDLTQKLTEELMTRIITYRNNVGDKD